jgi:hypothetical protein
MQTGYDARCATTVGLGPDVEKEDVPSERYLKLQSSARGWYLALSPYTRSSSNM